MDISSFCEAAANLSVLAVEFKDQISELDINPVKIMEHGCTGLDALIVLNSGSSKDINDSKAINM